MPIFRKIDQIKMDFSISSLVVYLIKTPLRRIRILLAVSELKKTNSAKERFTIIYKANIWGSRESVSGVGSSLEFTQNIRAELPKIFEIFEIKSLLDAPCGDFNWMSRVDLRDITYVGADIVSPLICHLQKKYSTSKISFIDLDLTKDPLPKSDLVLNRDCLFHLSYADILGVLKNFVYSNSSYFLSTSHDNNNEFTNNDIASGDFRPIDLFASPFNFSKDFLYSIPEPGDGEIPPRRLYLWNQNHVQMAVSNLQTYLNV